MALLMLDKQLDGYIYIEIKNVQKDLHILANFHTGTKRAIWVSHIRTVIRLLD